jgi:hypothetical protein
MNKASVSGCMFYLFSDPDDGGNISLHNARKPTRLCDVPWQDIMSITGIAVRTWFPPSSQKPSTFLSDRFYSIAIKEFRQKSMCFLCSPLLIINIKRQFMNMWESWGLLYQRVNQFQCHQSWLQNNLMCNTEASVLLSYIKLCKYGL